jgi:hypothetical protein
MEEEVGSTTYEHRMIDKDSIKRRRDSAVFANLGIETGDRIVSMISRRDGPNDIDPEMEHDDAPIAQTLIAAKGSRSPIVARTILQAKDFSQFIPDEERQRRVQDIAWEVMASLLAIGGLVNGLRTAIDAKQAEILPNYSLYSVGSSPPPVPIVENLVSG